MLEDELEAVRAALAAAGHPDLAVESVLGGPQAMIRGPRTTVGSLYKHEDGSWLVVLGARRSGGYRGSVTGAPGEAVTAVLARAIATTVRPFGPPPSLDEELDESIAQALERLAREDAFVATDASGAPFRWTPIFATEKKKELRAAFTAAVAVLDRRLAVAAGTSGAARVWPHGGGSIVLWQTDHDPGAGLQLQLARWIAAVNVPLPPW